MESMDRWLANPRTIKFPYSNSFHCKNRILSAFPFPCSPCADVILLSFPIVFISLMLLKCKCDNYVSVWIAACWVKDALLATMRGVREVVVIVFLAICSMANAIKPCPRGTVVRDEVSYCLSWRMSVEANNMAGWRTVPMQCLPYIQGYMIGGQYDRDMAFIADQILSYVKGIVLSDDGMDAWILDVDDTCISNLFYYKGKRFGYFFSLNLIFFLGICLDIFSREIVINFI